MNNRAKQKPLKNAKGRLEPMFREDLLGFLTNGIPFFRYVRSLKKVFEILISLSYRKVSKA